MAKPGRFRRAMTALKKLIADKEDTKQVFIILEAMAGNSGLVLATLPKSGDRQGDIIG